MLVFRARPRRDPARLPTLTNSERRMMRVLGDAMREVRAQVVADEGKLLDAIAHASADRIANMVTVEPWLAAQPTIEEELVGELLSAGQRVKLPPMRKATVTFGFDAKRPEASRWAAKEAGGLIVEIIEDQRNVVKDYVSRAALGEFTPQQVARSLRDTIGLTTQQSGWVENFRQRQISERLARGMTFDQAVADSERATNRYHDRIHKYRTETIARTEILRASNEGRKEAWEQGVQEGFIDPAWVKRWSTEFDDRTCDECEPLDGETAPVLGDFPWGDPPLHPNCRCTLLLEEPDEPTEFADLTDDELEELIYELMDQQSEDPTQPTEDDPYDSYRGRHEAPGRDDGAPMHDLTGGGEWYPEDVYGPDGARFYGTGSGSDLRPMEDEVIRLFRQVRDDPDATVTIYRALPSSVEDATINAGDWVTPSRGYAEYHGEGPLQGDYQIIAIEVKASELFTEANSLLEWGYDPLPVD